MSTYGNTSEGPQEFEEDRILAQYEHELADLQEKMAPGMEELILEEAAREIQAQMTEMRRQLEMITEKQKKFQGQKFDVRREIRHTEMNIRDAQHAAAVAKAAREQLAALQQKAVEFDEVTKFAEWRKGNHLMRHQYDGAHFIAAARRCIVADGMGTGKTRQAIAGCDMLQAKRILIITPGETMYGWEREFNKFAPSRKAVILGKQPYEKIQKPWLAMLQMDVTNECVVIVNYETWNRNQAVVKDLIRLRFDTVICDEAHEIKKGAGVQFNSVKSIIYAENSCPREDCSAVKLRGEWMCTAGHHDADMGYSVKNVIMMTGTPIPNNPMEMFPLLNLVDRWTFSNSKQYERMYCTRYDGMVTWRFGGEKALARKISGFYIRRTMKDAGIVLPPQDIVVHDIEFDAEAYPLQAKMLEMLLTRAQIAIDADRVSSPMQMLPLILRQRQAIVWPGGIKLREPVYDSEGWPVIDPETGDQVTEIIPVGLDYQESIKLDRAEALLDQLNADGHRVAVYSQFASVIEEFEKRLKHRGISVCSFYGKVKDEDYRREMIRNFDASENEPVKWQNIIANFKSGGVGLTMTQCTAIIVLDEEWNPAMNEQAYHRIWRIGQERNTQVHILRVENSIDDWMAALIERKRALIEGFNDAAKQFDLMTELKKMFDR